MLAKRNEITADHRLIWRDSKLFDMNQTKIFSDETNTKSINLKNWLEKKIKVKGSLYLEEMIHNIIKQGVVPAELKFNSAVIVNGILKIDYLKKSILALDFHVESEDINCEKVVALAKLAGIDIKEVSTGFLIEYNV